MSELPDPTDSLTGDDLATWTHMTQVRGEGSLGDVYVRMFNNPSVATKVGELGELLRYGGTLPGDVRELVILHLARRMGIGYEWVHHLRPAAEAGLPQSVIDAIASGTTPVGLRPEQTAALHAADATFELRSIPDASQSVIVDAFGTAGAVELVALVGLYRLIGGMITAFDVQIEDGFPTPPF